MSLISDRIRAMKEGTVFAMQMDDGIHIYRRESIGTTGEVTFGELDIAIPPEDSLEITDFFPIDTSLDDLDGMLLGEVRLPRHESSPPVISRPRQMIPDADSD